MKKGLLQGILTGLIVTASAQAEEAKPEKVSFYNDIRPIFQASCHGCHQPAKARGEYVMTTFEELLKGGDSDEVAIVPGKPDESHLITLITPIDGQAEMPQKADPSSRGSTRADLPLGGRGCGG